MKLKPHEGPSGCEPAQQRLTTSWKRVLRGRTTGVAGKESCEA